MVCSRKATITMNRPLKTSVWRLRKRRSGKASLFWKYAELNVGLKKKKKTNNRYLCWHLFWDVSQEWETHDCRHATANWRKGLVIKWQRTWSHCVHVFMGCRKVEFVREEGGRGNPRGSAEWVAWSVVLFVSVTVFWVFIVKLFQKKEMASVRTVHQRRNQLKVWKPLRLFVLKEWEGLGRGESTRCMYDQGARKHVSQPSHMVQGPPKTT